MVLSVSIVGGFERYVIEEPVFQERWHEGSTLRVLDRRFQLGQLLLVKFKRFGRGCTIALKHYCVEFKRSVETTYNKGKPDK